VKYQLLNTIFGEELTNNDMKKSDLKTGMIIETREGETGLILKDNVLGIDAVVFNESSWTELKDFGEDLKWNFLATKPRDHNVDICKVYKPDLPTGFLSRKSRFETMELLWERKKEKPFMTLDGVDYSVSTLRSLIKKATS
jgi:hypothetical protein